MKRMAMCLIWVSWSVAFAQAPPGEEGTDGADVGGQLQPCVFADESGLLEREQEDAGAIPEPCEAEEPVATPGSEQQTAESVAEEDSLIEASADEVFEPGDEISEDYPVPLPADI